MITAVNEAARSLTPLSTLMSVGILKLIDLIINVVQRFNRDDKGAIEDLTYALRYEYPFETDEYIKLMARDFYMEAKDV